MTDDVKPRRTYVSPRRREQAEQTRAEILIAAGRLFRERGYRVPMTAIAAEAGVVVETVYRLFGGKANLFRSVVEAMLAGGVGRADVSVEERPAIRAMIEEPDPRRQLALYAATQPGIHRRAGPVLRALRDARRTDEELARLWDEMEDWRLAGQSRVVRMLEGGGALRSDRTVEELCEILWTLSSLAVYDLLVLDRGWSDDRYEAWLAGSLTAELLGC